MAPPIINETQYFPNDFQFNPIEYPKDDFIEYDIKNRILSKFISKNEDNINDKYYSKVYYFILNNIIPDYDELFSCIMLHEDIDGNSNIIFNIIFNNEMSFSKRNELHYNILEKICEFCDSSNFSHVFEEITILLVEGR